MEKAEHAQNLQSNQYNKNQQMEFFVLKHAAEKKKTEQPTGPQLNPESQHSDENEQGASRYFLEAILQFGGAFCSR